MNAIKAPIPNNSIQLKTTTQAKTTIATNTLLHQTNLLARCSTSKWERWTKDDDSAMQPASPMEFTAMCDERGVHKRSWKQRAPRNKYTKTTTILHASYAGSDGAWWRRCAAHDDDKVRIATNNQDITKLLNQCNQSPFFHNHIQLKITTQKKKQKQQCQQTPCSIKQTYCRDSVLSNEKDGPKMTTAQCNRPRRWSCLQCVRDGERTKHHENSARHATNK